MFVVAANAPGRANVDAAYSARQALGWIPFDDWHPAVIAALWKALLDLTGEISSLFYLQVGVFFAATAALAGALWRLTGRSLAALPILFFPLFPFVLTQLGIVWKDTLMSVALLAAVAALLVARTVERVGWRSALVALALVFLLFGTMVRKNAAFAVVPLIVLLLVIAWPRIVRLRPLARATCALAAVAAFGGLTVASTAAVNSAYSVAPASQISQVFLDDIIFSVPAEDIAASSAPAPLKEHLLSAQRTCREKGAIWDAYIKCYGRGVTGELFSPIAYQDEVRDLWVAEVLPHPGRYLEYRAMTFATFLTNVSVEYLPTSADEEARPVGLGPERSTAESVQGRYIQGFAVGNFPWLFLPVFWLAVGIAAFALGLALRRLGVVRWPAVALAASGVLYLLGYFPIIPADHFRYTYWPSLSGTLAVILIVAGLSRASASRASSGPHDTR